MRSTTPNGATVTALLFTTALALAGCWTAPIANVQPKGEPRLIQGAILVDSVRQRAVVESVDIGARTVVLANPDRSIKTAYRVGPRLSNLDRIKAGDKVQATIAEELTVYVLKNGQLPDAAGAPRNIRANAKVLMVDPSYRLLTLQYPDGQNETFKVGLDVRLQQMEAGDDVVIRSVELKALQVRRP
jgi:hypothetical protein